MFLKKKTGKRKREGLSLSNFFSLSQLYIAKIYHKINEPSLFVN